MERELRLGNLGPITYRDLLLDEDCGGQETVESLIANSGTTKLVRLKTAVLAGITKKYEQGVITLLCEGYTQSEIASELKVSKQFVNRTIRIYRKNLSAEQIELIFSTVKEDTFSDRDISLAMYRGTRPSRAMRHMTNITLSDNQY